MHSGSWSCRWCHATNPVGTPTCHWCGRTADIPNPHFAPQAPVAPHPEKPRPRRRFFVGCAAFVAGVGAVGLVIAGLMFWRQAQDVDLPPIEISLDPLDPVLGRVKIPASAGSDVKEVLVERGPSPSSPPSRATFVLADQPAVVADLNPQGLPHRVHAADGTELEISYLGSSVRGTFTEASGRTRIVTKKLSREAQKAIEAQRRLFATSSSAVPDRRNRLGAIERALVGTAHAKTMRAEARRAVRFDLRVEPPSGRSTVSRGVQLTASCSQWDCRRVGNWRVLGGRASPTLLHTASGSVDYAAPTDLAERTRTCERSERQANNTLGVVGLVLGAIGVGAGGPVGTAAGVAGLLGSFASITTDPLCVDQVEQGAANEQLARQLAKQSLEIRVCADHADYESACASMSYAPFGFSQATPRVGSLTVRLRAKGGGGTADAPRDAGAPRRPAVTKLSGDFTLLQQDGGRCGFSRGPSTGGPPGSLQIEVLETEGIIRGELRGSGSGQRRGLECGEEKSSFRWTQKYAATFGQSIGSERLRSAGALDVTLTGKLTGTGTTDYFGCTKNNRPVQCPARESNRYEYPVKLTGRIDIDRKTGRGSLRLENVGLATAGSWTLR